MSEIQNSKSKAEQAEKSDAAAADLVTVDGELLESIEPIEKSNAEKRKAVVEIKEQKTTDAPRNQKSLVQYIFLPAIFLLVALLGGLRFDAASSAFLFLKPALICLIYASVLLVLFFRARLIELENWFSEDFSNLKTAANAGVLLTLFFASVQIFNSLLPERGLPFWTVAFCFFWTLWNNLFSEFDARKLIKSLVGMFALAFLVKYLILANLAAPTADSFWQRITENPTKEAFTYLLDLPQFAAATGYAQFFAVAFYLIGLFSINRKS